MEWLATPEGWISLLTLTLLEIVLGIDNIVFISILAAKLPQGQQATARQYGLGLALISRLCLLMGIAWIASLTQPLITLTGKSFSGRDLILLLGGIFLITKATHEIYEKLEGNNGQEDKGNRVTFSGVLVQIALLDLVFSLDSVITAVGMVQEVSIMVTAVIISMVIMLLFVNSVSRFIEAHPSLKILALSFLIMIGFVLTLEGFHVAVQKGYIYTAMAFSLVVELINIKLRKRHRTHKVKLNQPYH